MTYKPTSKDKTAVFLSLILAFACIFLLYFSSVFAVYPMIFQIIALFFAVFALQIYLKYIYSNYVYEACENDLKIYRISGKKSICVCSLSYEESTSKVFSSEYYETHKSELPKVRISTNFCKNIFPKDYYLYYFNFNSKQASLKFEPDEIFVKFLNEKIENALLRKERFENSDYGL
ncbi:MAG: hypothetical protein IKX77_02365 [Clostridia bacterium]|nr:hypothetical protein [Clostridia bacterium]